jgi:molybdopterin-binding protein
LEGEVKISIPPEDIILSAGKFVSSARNMHKGKVVDIISDEKNSKVLLDIGVPLLSIITNKSALEMNIKKGDELYAIFKTMSVRVIK